MRFYINEPIWKSRSVGLAVDKMVDDPVEVEITYKKKDGEREYPHLYTMPLSVALNFPDFPEKKGGHVLKQIPITAFKVKELR